MKQVTIMPNDANQRVDKFLTKSYPNLPQSMLYKAIRKKDIKLNGKRCEISTRLQEGDRLTGYVIHTETLLQKYRENGAIVPPRFYNGVVRSAETVVLFNLGSDTAGLDCYLYPVQDMAAGSISVALGAGAHKAAFPAAVSAGDELALLASSRKCLLNGSPAEKRGFFQYTAAGDSKHPVTVEEHKSARLLFEFQEMQEGGDRF